MSLKTIRKNSVAGRRVVSNAAVLVRRPVGFVPPATRLKQLRRRSGMTALECAKLSGVGTTPGAWYRYESTMERDMGKELIPDAVIMSIIPHMIGRGEPPIREEEIISLAQGQRFLRAMKDRKKIAGKPALSLKDVAPTFPKSASGVKHLTVKYRAERGIFMGKEAFERRTYGVGPIVEAPEFRAPQACVLVADDHADSVYPVGTVLHIIHQSAYSPKELLGKRVVISVETNELVSVEVGVIHGIHGNRYEFRSLEGDRKIEGDLVGVVHRSLHIE